MRLFRFVNSLLIVAVACVVATMWLGWMSLPVIGFTYGLVDRRGRARGSAAAIGAVLAWLGILFADAARGADVRAVAEQMGAVTQLPALAFVAVTFVVAAILCGTSAVLGVGAAERVLSGHYQHSRVP